ncbi:MAG TPA: non-homologous end-joining DNA ligase [Candidatus Methylacidiphilales bacterium]
MAAPRRLKFVEPMKAAVAAPPPENGPWLYEVKFDGFRVLAVKNGKEVELWSRNKKRLDERFPKVAAAVAKLSVKDCVIDGEVCALNAQGRSSFQLLQNSAEPAHPIFYYVFDVLFEGTKDLRSLPLMERKAKLEAILLNAVDPIRPSPFFTENPGEILAKMKSAGAEGSIAKLTSSVYETGRRSGTWVKIKFHKGQEFVIAGYTLPKKSRQYFGALILGYYRGKRLIFAGRVGTGFNEKSLKEIYQKLKPIESDIPLVEEIQEPSGRWRPKGWRASDSRWVKPKLVAQVQFTEWTDDGILRHPSFLGLRVDKNPADVVRE